MGTVSSKPEPSNIESDNSYTDSDDEERSSNYSEIVGEETMEMDRSNPTEMEPFTYTDCNKLPVYESEKKDGIRIVITVPGAGQVGQATNCQKEREIQVTFQNDGGSDEAVTAMECDVVANCISDAATNLKIPLEDPKAEAVTCANLVCEPASSHGDTLANFINDAATNLKIPLEDPKAEAVTCANLVCEPASSHGDTLAKSLQEVKQEDKEAESDSGDSRKETELLNLIIENVKVQFRSDINSLLREQDEIMDFDLLLEHNETLKDEVARKFSKEKVLLESLDIQQRLKCYAKLQESLDEVSEEVLKGYQLETVKGWIRKICEDHKLELQAFTDYMLTKSYTYTSVKDAKIARKCKFMDTIALFKSSVNPFELNSENWKNVNDMLSLALEMTGDQVIRDFTEDLTPTEVGEEMEDDVDDLPKLERCIPIVDDKATECTLKPLTMEDGHMELSLPTNPAPENSASIVDENDHLNA